MDFTKFRNSERTGWNTRASGYGDATARATLQTLPTVLAHGKLFPNAQILDAGCGPGYVAGMASLLGAQAHGIDFAPKMVAEAQARFPECTFSEGDVEDLDFGDQSFDRVLSNIVLFHVTDPKRAMAEAHRVLRSKGRFVFSQWLGPDLSECYAMLFAVLGELADMSRADPAPNAYALSDRETVAAMLHETGFLAPTFEVVSNVLHAQGPSFFDFFMQFGVRVPLILARQDEDVQAAIRQEVDARAQMYFANGVYRIPMPSLVISAEKA